MYPTHAIPRDTRRGRQIPCNWSYRQLQTLVRVLRIAPYPVEKKSVLLTAEPSHQLLISVSFPFGGLFCGLNLWFLFLCWDDAAHGFSFFSISVPVPFVSAFPKQSYLSRRSQYILHFFPMEVGKHQAHRHSEFSLWVTSDWFERTSWFISIHLRGCFDDQRWCHLRCVWYPVMPRDLPFR